MKKLILSLLFIGMTLPAFAETVRFAMEASYPPFEFTDDSNKIQGFDVDLATALCKEFGAEATFSNQQFDNLIPSLKFRRIDAAISAMDITPERQKQVLFSAPYYENSAIFVTLKDKPANMTSTKGLRVGVQNGTTHQKYVTDKHPEMTCSAYDNYQNAILDMKSGRLDVVFGDTAVVNEWLKTNPDLVTVGDIITDKDYFGIGMGIAVRSDNKALQAKFDEALDKIKKNGTYKAIYDKWFSQH